MGFALGIAGVSESEAKASAMTCGSMDEEATGSVGGGIRTPDDSGLLKKMKSSEPGEPGCAWLLGGEKSIELLERLQTISSSEVAESSAHLPDGEEGTSNEGECGRAMLR